MLVNSAISDPQSSQVNENCNQLNHASHMSLLLYIKGPFPEYSTCTLVTAGDVRPMFQTSRLSDCDAVSKSDIGRREAERGRGMLVIFLNKMLTKVFCSHVHLSR